MIHDKPTKWDKIIAKLKPSDGIRCPAMAVFGSQCEGHQGHEGPHWVMNRRTYFDHAWGIFGVDDE